MNSHRDLFFNIVHCVLKDQFSFVGALQYKDNLASYSVFLAEQVNLIPLKEKVQAFCSKIERTELIKSITDPLLIYSDQDPYLKDKTFFYSPYDTLISFSAQTRAIMDAYAKAMVVTKKSRNLKVTLPSLDLNLEKDQF